MAYKLHEGARVFLVFLERYIGYLALLLLFFYQRHMADIKESDILTLYYAERTEMALVFMESAQRGYLYAGDPDMLKDFSRANSSYGYSLRKLTDLLHNDPYNYARAQFVKQRADAKIIEMKETLELSRQGHPDQAKQLVQTRQGQRFMSDVRDGIDDIRSSKEIQAISNLGVYW